MKRGISRYPDYDRSGRWCLVIEKAKGRLTLDDITETAREYEEDYYLLALDCYHDPNDMQYGDEPEGDKVVLYRMGFLSEEG